MAKQIKTEEFIVKAGVATPLNGERITAKGMYLEPTAAEVVVIPAKGFGKPRRIVLYPANSVRPFPVGAPVVNPPDAMRPEDFLNLYGPYPPTLLRRATAGLLAEFEKFRLKDWIVIATSGGALVAASVAAVYAYKLWKLVSH